jgi:hypothetical protein
MGYTRTCRTNGGDDTLYDIALELCYGNAVQNKTALTHMLLYLTVGYVCTVDRF